MNNNTTKSPKIENIYPLTDIQQGLLFHHLVPGKDEGFLMVQCTINGDVNTEYLKDAWEKAVKRHEMMRTSVHWKNVKQPVLVVQPEKPIIWTFLNWTNLNENDQQTELENYKKERKTEGAVLDKYPLSKISLIQIKDKVYYFLWECHHLLLDGWSSTIILKDAFSYYDASVNSTPVELTAITTQKAYKNWLKNLDTTKAEEFWQHQFEGFKISPLFQKETTLNQEQSSETFNTKFSFDTSSALRQVAKSYKITLNTLFQGIWALVLAKYFNHTDIVFGNTVSGRSIPFPNIDKMAGMFANILPVRCTLQPSKPLGINLSKFQSEQQNVRNFEYCQLNEILTYASHEDDKPLFDSLFIFENFPWQTIKSGNLEVSGFKSGITTTYPVTIAFIIEDEISYNLIVDTNTVNTATANWLTKAIHKTVQTVIKDEHITVQTLQDQLTDPPTKIPSASHNNAKPNNELDYLAPRNETELKLLEIWEQLFGKTYISVEDSFFALGGKSLLAVKMFGLIEAKFGIKLPPTTILEHPNIAALAAIISSKSEIQVKPWQYLIPIKTKGNKTPLFCIHAGGGHVFFYKSLSECVHPERPLYALQPLGVFGEENKHISVEDMAKDYANEIHELQPNGTLNILVYCFSTAVGLEMEHYLKTLNRDAHIIVADTIAEHRLLLDKERLAIRISAFLKRLLSNPFKALQLMIGYRILFYIKPLKIKLFGSEAEKNTENMRQHLVKLFNAYRWEKKANTVSLVLTEKNDDRYNNEIIRSWSPLTNNDIRVKTTKGNHNTFFDYPDVEHTAKVIDSIIME